MGDRKLVRLDAHTQNSMKLTRIVRLAIPAPAPSSAARSHDPWMMHFELEVTIAGTPDATTGYIVGIQEIDAAVRAAAPALLQGAMTRGETPPSILPSLRIALQTTLGLDVVRLTIRQHALALIATEHAMPNHAVLTHRFDFAASHRLHCASLSDEANRRVFGKCNNPAGHGHNYRLETEVRVPLLDPPALRSEEIERLAHEHVVERLDHKHLNTDVPCFGDKNPSVEAIAKVCFDWLQPAIRTAGAELVRVRVWETEKTSAIYPE